MSYEVGPRCRSDPALLWRNQAVTALPLAWELPYAAGAALKKKKRKKEGREGKKGRKPDEEGRAALVCIPSTART